MTETSAISSGLLRMAPGPGAASADALALQRQLKLKDAAEQFEGMMLQEMLKPMQEGKDGAGSFGGVGAGFSTGDEDRDDTLDTLGSFGIEAVANAIAKAGGIGLARQVMREVGALDTYSSNAAGANLSAGGGDRSAAKGDDRGGAGYNGGPKDRNGSLDGNLKKKS